MLSLKYMDYVKNHKLVVFCVVFFVIILAIVIANLVAVLYNGKSVEAPEIPRAATTIGDGSELKYLILGDSTSIAQGGDYIEGFAVKTAENLGRNNKVTYQNFGVSGARIKDVATDQIERSKDFTPDIVLIAVGANDVTHLTGISSIKTDMQVIISKLKKRNNKVKIVFTGAASMGDVVRFIQPFKWYMGQQTKKVNTAFEQIAKENGVSFAYIARETGEEFANNPKLFAQDNFHPSNDGYAVWARVLNKVLDDLKL